MAEKILTQAQAKAAFVALRSMAAAGGAAHCRWGTWFEGVTVFEDEQSEMEVVVISVSRADVMRREAYPTLYHFGLLYGLTDDQGNLTC